MIVWRLSGGIDQFTGVAGQDNVFLIEQDSLGPNDNIVGGSTGLLNDALVAIDAEDLNASKFVGVSNIELLYLLSASASTVLLTNNLVQIPAAAFLLCSVRRGAIRSMPAA